MAICCAILCLLIGCQNKQVEPATLADLVQLVEPTDLKVLLVGIDGATFSVIDRMLRAGKLPTMKKLIEQGARGPLASRHRMLSPALWTTVVTGHPRGKHGITGFVNHEEGSANQWKRLVSSNDRRSLALWNILGPFGKSSGFVGWWASWPAEPVSGWIVSDRMTRSFWNEWMKADRGGQLTFPRQLGLELGQLRVDPMTAPIDEITTMADFSGTELAELIGATRPLYAHWLSIFKFAYCSQRSYERMTLRMLSKGQPDLTGVYLMATDAISHTFWHFYEPEKFEPGGVDPDMAARLGKIIPNIYAHNDAYVGELLRSVEDGTVVFIVSDHGFEASGHLPQSRRVPEFGPFAELVAESLGAASQEELKDTTVTVGQSGIHHTEGVFIASGGPIRVGARAEVGLLDIAPTILALMGLPVPDDMPGRVLAEIVEPAFWTRHPIRRIDSFESLIAREEVPTGGSMGDEEAVQMLKALGYMQ